MKKLILSVIMMLIVTSVLKSQDRPPSPLTFTYRANDTMRVNEPLKREYFIQKEVILGTQWYGHPRMLKALKMDVNHGTPDDSYLIANTDTAIMKYIWENKLPNKSKNYIIEILSEKFIELYQKIIN